MGLGGNSSCAFEQGKTIMVMAVISSVSAVLVGAGVALVWMSWAFVKGRSAPSETLRSRGQRAPKIVRI
jgi:hypothetical protein